MFESLIESAAKARLEAYAPYSNFLVGAALLTKSNRVFTGGNVENISLGLTICAERAAVAAAVSNGERNFVALALVTASAIPVMPCGACRQVLAEFNRAMTIVAVTVEGKSETTTLAELLPQPLRGILDNH